jgi:molybdopterin-guanine dinucleotide biosynthesis protein
MQTKAVSFVAKSGTGKTTLLEQVIGDLKNRGLRVGVIKHDAHRFDIDHPGKDSYRLAAAGADTMLISSPEKLAIVKKHPASPPKGSSWAACQRLRCTAGKGAPRSCVGGSSTTRP